MKQNSVELFIELHSVPRYLLCFLVPSYLILLHFLVLLLLHFLHYLLHIGFNHTSFLTLLVISVIIRVFHIGFRSIHMEVFLEGEIA